MEIFVIFNIALVPFCTNTVIEGDSEINKQAKVENEKKN